MKTGNQKEFFKLFYRAERMVAKGKDPMEAIGEAISLAYIGCNSEVMMRRLHQGRYAGKLAVIERKQITLSLESRLVIHKWGCPF